MKVLKSNKELLILIRKDDKVAFYNLYERYSKKLYAFVLQLIKLEEDAEEIVQEVFIKIWEKRKTLNEYSSFESFLFTIAYNTTMSLLRKKVTENKYLAHLQSIQQVNNTVNLTDEIYFNELNEQLAVLLDEVSARQKEIFLLSRKEGLTHEQIAKKLNITVNTVKKHISNTISFLKSHLDSGSVVSAFYFLLFLL